MATYKDDLDIIKAAISDKNKLSLNAITELDNKGMLGMYGGGVEDILAYIPAIIRADVELSDEFLIEHIDSARYLKGGFSDIVDEYNSDSRKNMLMLFTNDSLWGIKALDVAYDHSRYVLGFSSPTRAFDLVFNPDGTISIEEEEQEELS